MNTLWDNGAEFNVYPHSSNKKKQDTFVEFGHQIESNVGKYVTFGYQKCKLLADIIRYYKEK